MKNVDKKNKDIDSPAKEDREIRKMKEIKKEKDEREEDIEAKKEAQLGTHNLMAIVMEPG